MTCDMDIKEIFAIVFFSLGAFAVLNILYSFLFILTKNAGGMYRWLIKDFDVIEIGAFPLFGPTYYVSEKLYNRYNWFNARLILLGWAIFLLLFMILMFYLFSLM